MAQMTHDLPGLRNKSPASAGFFFAQKNVDTKGH